MWRGEEVQFAQGEAMLGVRTLPRPVQPELPFWLATTGRDDSFAAAGDMGAHVLTHLLGQDMADLTLKIGLCRAVRLRAGYAGRGKVTLMVHTFFARDRQAALADALTPLKLILPLGLI
ncbi:MAG: LLM class flavin-dependent oxidoreductase [Rhizobiaceae bacterium]